MLISTSVPEKEQRNMHSAARRHDNNSADEDVLPSLRSVRNSLIAGYVAGMTGTMIGYPMDTIKVWMQTGKGGFASSNKSKKLAPNPERTPKTTLGSIATSAPSRERLYSSKPYQAIVCGCSSSTSNQKRPQPYGRSSFYNNTTFSTRRSASSAIQFFWKRQLSPQVSTLTKHVGSLYSGVVGPLVSVGAVQSMNFAMYDSTRRLLRGNNHHAHGNPPPLWHVGVSAMSAGAVLALVTNPLQIIKVQQQTRNTSFRNALRSCAGWKDNSKKSSVRMVRTTISNLYAGFAPHCFMEVFGRGIYFCTYEAMKEQLLLMHGNGEDNNVLCLQDRMLAAATSGITCWSIFFPIDAIRCRMFASVAAKQKKNAKEFSTAWQTARSMYRQGGASAFYRGYSLAILRAGPVAATVLPVYDFASDWLNSDD